MLVWSKNIQLGSGSCFSAVDFMDGNLCRPSGLDGGVGHGSTGCPIEGCPCLPTKDHSSLTREGPIPLVRHAPTYLPSLVHGTAWLQSQQWSVLQVALLGLRAAGLLFGWQLTEVGPPPSSGWTSRRGSGFAIDFHVGVRLPSIHHFQHLQYFAFVRGLADPGGECHCTSSWIHCACLGNPNERCSNPSVQQLNYPPRSCTQVSGVRLKVATFSFKSDKATNEPWMTRVLVQLHEFDSPSGSSGKVTEYRSHVIRKIPTSNPGFLLAATFLVEYVFKHISYSDSDRNSLKMKLLQLQCHFTWNLQMDNVEWDDLQERLNYIMESDIVKYKAMPYNLLAFVNCMRGNCKESFNNLREAEEILSKNHRFEIAKWSIVTYGNAAWVYYHMGELAEAQSSLDKVERICQQFADGSQYTAMIPEIYGQKGWSLLKFGWKYYEEANECLEKALEEDPDNIEWNAAHATALFRLKESFGVPQCPEDCKAVKQLHRALALNPNDSFLMLALRLQEFNQIEKFHRLLEEVLLMSPDDPYIIQYAAKVLRKQGSVDYSLQILKKALEVRPNSPLLHHQIGLCYKKKLFALKKTPFRYFAREERKKCIDLCTHHFQIAFDQKPSLIFAILDLAEVFGESEEYSKADEIYENLLRNKDCNLLNRQLILWNYGCYQLYEKCSQLNAIHHFKECLKLKVKSKKNEKCRAKLKQIAEDRMNKYSRDSVAFGILGLIHQVDGKKSEAIEFFEKALECDHVNEEFQSALRELHQAT
ncbi:interferon-induced protein with tetratricopeptide repeats 5-like [Heterodontus francisci]|uniref:interferon-induced protein with tetratricopeptide repeats 5-like n=1 Tax=Heterodontus francisci TaxID=7792 RepID=UPI00355B364E